MPLVFDRDFVQSFGRFIAMAQVEKHEGSHGESGGGWFLSFILSLGLWGGVLFGMVMLGHHLAK
jgi:hypothetical protein